MLPLTLELKARELLVAVRRAGKTTFIDTIYPPEQDIPEGEYWRVIVERVKIEPTRFSINEVYTAVPEYAGEGVA
jgi:hypothetical protein